MFPGLTTKLSESILASAATIDPKTDLVVLTGTTQINTILPHFGPTFSGVLFLLPKDGTVTLGTSGNILIGKTIPQNTLCALVFSRSQNAWVINITA